MGINCKLLSQKIARTQLSCDRTILEYIYHKYGFPTYVDFNTCDKYCSAEYTPKKQQYTVADIKKSLGDCNPYGVSYKHIYELETGELMIYTNYRSIHEINILPKNTQTEHIIELLVHAHLNPYRGET